MPKRVLVVEDEPDILKVIVFRLKKAGYEVIHAANGKEALDIVRGQDKADLILLDLVMPVMDGSEFCRILKGDDALRRIPVIILSASTAKDIAEKAREIKANDYIVKPFEPEILLSKIEALLK